VLRRRAVLVGAAFAAGGVLMSGRAQAQPTPAHLTDIHPNQRLRVDGRERRYRLVRPASARAGAPLMIALHGMGVDAISLMPLYSGLDDLARAHGAILVYPASLRNHWPLSFGVELATELRFLDTLVDRVQTDYGTDPRQIYLLGMSNGGYFAVAVASRRSQHLAGLAIHSGSAGVLGVGFETVRKFPVYIAHGDADPILNVRDGRWLAGMFERMGHPTRYEEFAGLGHVWARDQGVNERIWTHWQQHRA
jgi:polyhydroxybutyrate depolymerase